MRNAGPEPPASRFVPALVLAALVVAGAWGVWASRPTGGDGAAGWYDVSVVDPSGALWWNGTVPTGAPATPLSTLRAAGAAGGFEVDVEEHALGAYVTGIGPFAETATGGWNYCVRHGGAYEWVGAAADVWRLSAGDGVQWRWAEGGSEVC